VQGTGNNLGQGTVGPSMHA